MKTLSVLIPSMHSRFHMLDHLCLELYSQAIDCGHEFDFEILTQMDNGEISTGKKRNELLDKANHDYVVFFDDDDWPEPGYCREIFDAIQQEPDVVGFDGTMTTNGKNPTPWKISKDLPYKTVIAGINKVMYLRFNNHLSPIKKEIARAIKFPDLYHGEDYDYALRLKKSGLIKTEVYIQKELYHYRYITKK